MERGYNVAVAGIPKTIDNDGTFVSGILLKFFFSDFSRLAASTVDYIDHSFGFSSAVEAACHSIRSAKTEAVCNLPNVRACNCSFHLSFCFESVCLPHRHSFCIFPLTGYWNSQTHGTLLGFYRCARDLVEF